MNRLEALTKVKYFDVLFWAIILSIAFFVRFYNLAGLSLRLDEAQSIWQASHTLEFIRDYMLKNVHLPLHNTLLHFWIRAFGTSEFSVRFMSLIPGMLSVPALYFLSKELIGKKASYITAIIGALSPMWVWYSREIRMYTLLTFISILSYLFFVRLLKYGKFRDYFFYTLVNVVGIYTHYFFGLILIVQVLYFVVGFKSKKLNFKFYKPKEYTRTFSYLALSGLIFFASFFPWIYQLMVHYGSGSLAPVLAEPTAFNIILSYFEFLNGFLPNSLTSILISLWPVVILVSFMFLTKRQNPFSPGIYLAMLGATVPIVLVYVASVLVTPMYLTRYLIAITPMFYILIAWYLKELKGASQAVIVPAFFVMLTVSLAVQGLSVNSPVRESYREAISFIEESTTPRDIVLVSPPYTIYPFNYYYEGNSAVSTLPIWNKKKGAIPETTEEVLKTDTAILRANRQKFYLMLTTGLHGSDIVKEYFDKHYTKLDKKQFSKDVWVEIYQAEYR